MSFRKAGRIDGDIELVKNIIKYVNTFDSFPEISIPPDSPETIRERKELVRMALNLLENLHTHCKFAHNDSHPYNFMFDDKGKLYLIDFGLAYKIIYEKDEQLDIEKFQSFLAAYIDCFDNLEYLYDIIPRQEEVLSEKGSSSSSVRSSARSK